MTDQCRLLVFAASRGSDLLVKLVRALCEAAKFDPYLGYISGATSHDDGWGYAVIQEGRAYVYKTSKPIFGDYKQLRKLLELLKTSSGEVQGLVHVRKAGRTEPIGERHAHPYEYRIDGCAFYFAHNGSVDKWELANGLLRELRINVEEFTDSYIAGKYLALEISRGGRIHEAYVQLLKYIRTALNTGLLITCSNESPRLYATCVIKDKYRRDRRYHNYYKMYVVLTKELSAVYSSTIYEYLADDKASRALLRHTLQLTSNCVMELEPGRLSVVNLDHSAT